MLVETHYMKKGVLILLDINPPQGAENVAVNIAVKLKESSKYTPIVCSTRKGGVLEERLRSNNIKYFLLNRSNRYEFYKFLRLITILKDEKIKIITQWKNIIIKCFTWYNYIFSLYDI